MSDLTTFLDGMPPLVRPTFVNSWHRYIGDPADPEQRADMLARSPASRVGDIRCPLLIAQGANDVRIVRAESDTIVDALRDRGVEVDYLVFDDEGHRFVNPENRIAFHRAVERFLARHLGGREQRDDA